MYTELLAPELRLDVAFIPHIGIGNSADPRKCKKLTDSINTKDIDIEGKIDSLNIVQYENDTVVTIEKVSLGNC